MLSQIYEKILCNQMCMKYTYRCDRVRETCITANFLGLNRQLQVFSLSTNNGMSAKYDEWPGIVQSLQQYIRSENFLIKSKLNDRVKGMEGVITKKTLGIENSVGDLSARLNNVNSNIEDKLDALTNQFDEIKSLIKVMAEPSVQGEEKPEWQDA